MVVSIQCQCHVAVQCMGAIRLALSCIHNPCLHWSNSQNKHSGLDHSGTIFHSDNSYGKFLSVTSHACF